MKLKGFFFSETNTKSLQTVSCSLADREHAHNDTTSLMPLFLMTHKFPDANS